MKLSATREQILTPLQSVIGVVERRQTMPVLSNVLVAARNNRISVTPLPCVSVPVMCTSTDGSVVTQPVGTVVLSTGPAASTRTM